MTLSVRKYHWCRPQVDFLGRTESSNGIHPLRRLCQGIHDLREPESLQELEKAIGMFRYMTKFIRGFADSIEPLQALLSSGRQSASRVHVQLHATELFC